MGLSHCLLPQREPQAEDGGVLQPGQQPEDHLIPLVFFSLGGLPERQPGMVLGLDDQAAAGACARSVARGEGFGVLTVEGQQSALEGLERVLANAFDQRRKRQAGGPQQASQVALGDRGEPREEVAPLGLSDPAGTRVRQARAELRPLGCSGGGHGDTS